MMMVQSGGEVEIYDLYLGEMYLYWVCVPRDGFPPFIYGPDQPYTGDMRPEDIEDRNHADIPRNWHFIGLIP